MTHQQQRSAWSELQQRRGLEEARMTVQHLASRIAAGQTAGAGLTTGSESR